MTLPTHRFQRRACALAASTCLASFAHAQIASLAAPALAPASAASAPASPGVPAAAAAPLPLPRTSQLAPVVVTGNPLRSIELAAPVSVLTGDELVLRRAGSLGETLNGLPGVSSSYFGPNANRPMVRGLDGDRVRVLSNAGASLDASSLSFDHAVPIDPLIVDRVEVLRGPGALLYGGSAVGGVVNALDNRIPRYPLQGVSGAAELRLGGAESERGGAARVEAGNGQFALHADAFGRRTSDLKVPAHTPVADGAQLDRNDRIRNSAARTNGGALGASWTFGAGHVGLSADTYDSTYGVVAEPETVIRMKRDHVGASAEVSGLGGAFRRFSVQLNDTRYRHEEVGGSGAIGTTFKTAGAEARFELEHAPIGSVRGLLGAQFENFDFSALGDEAFVPSTHTRRQAVFVTEETPWSLGTLGFGARLERARVASSGDTDVSATKFGAASERRFSLRSASLSNVYKLGTEWSVSGTASLTERAPTSFELYANGLHAATGAYERGDPQLRSERGNNIDLALQWKSGRDHLRVGAYRARFSRFIALEASGSRVDVPAGDGGSRSVPEFGFKSVPARLHGVEIEGRRRLLDRGFMLDGSGKLDFTRATNEATGEPLPRIAPRRVTLGLDAARGVWSGRVEVEHAARQSRVPNSDTETAGYSIVNLSMTRKFTLGDHDSLWFLKLTNVGDKLAYNASTVETLRGLVPLPGRALKAGVRVQF